MREKPSKWKDGFTSPHRLCQGEEPFIICGKWYLYVWDSDASDHVVFDFTSDIFISYSEFQEYIEQLKLSGAIGNGK